MWHDRSRKPALDRMEAAMDWQERIVLDPDILVGKPVVKGTRLAVELIIDLMAEGWSEAEILRNYPGLTREDLQACLGYASSLLPAEKVYPLAGQPATPP
jgi:uncharacterized protein (DUF433 family)